MSAGQSTAVVFGRLYEASLTPPAGAPAGVLAQVGYGPDGSNPMVSTAWRWTSASFNAQFGNDDEFGASFGAPTVAVTTDFAYTYRFSFDGGQTFTYCDLDGAGSNAGLTFEAAKLGNMTVTP